MGTMMRFFGILLIFGLLAGSMPDAAFAQAADEPQRLNAVPHGTCTTDPQFSVPMPVGGSGLISTIVTEIQNVLNQISSVLFLTIVSDPGFIGAIQGLLTLYILFYGIMFTFGMVQLTMFDFVVRMVKIGVVILLVSPGAWDYFNNTVVTFFNAGTDEWINQITGAVLGIDVPVGTKPFATIDWALSQAVSAKMAVTLMAMFFTPPYGPIFGLLLALGLGTFVKAVLMAAWVYLMSLIVKALLFGIAPIFLSFLLFARTRLLFEGWLNQLVNATLQPILLFTFLAFFVELISVAIANILATPVCWTEWNESLRGSPFSVHYWRFTLCNGGTCEPYGGGWSNVGPQTGSGPIFPIDILGILVLVMLADLCSRFNNIVILVASDLASASVNLATMQGTMGEWFRGGNVRGTQGADGALLPNQRMMNKEAERFSGVGGRNDGPKT